MGRGFLERVKEMRRLARFRQKVLDLTSCEWHASTSSPSTTAVAPSRTRLALEAEAHAPHRLFFPLSLSPGPVMPPHVRVG